MKIKDTASPELARLEQEQIELAGRVALTGPFSSITQVRSVAGLAVHFPADGSRAIACCTVHRLPDLALVEEARISIASADLRPYRPAFISYRELPPLLEALRTIKTNIDVFLCDGHGIAHPRRIGLASHLGVMIGKPTIGCAKSPLYGEFTEPPPSIRGGYQFIKDDGEILGIVLRTKPFARPLFVSPGHLMDVELAGDLVLASCLKHRIPEPLRTAHQLARNEQG